MKMKKMNEWFLTLGSNPGQTRKVWTPIQGILSYQSGVCKLAEFLLRTSESTLVYYTLFCLVISVLLYGIMRVRYKKVHLCLGIHLYLSKPYYHNISRADGNWQISVEIDYRFQTGLLEYLLEYD